MAPQRLDPWSGVAAEIVHADLYPCAPSWRVETAVNNRHTLFFAVKGRCQIERDGERFTLETGDLGFLLRGHRIACWNDRERPLTVYSVGVRFAAPGGADPLRALTLPDKLSLSIAAASGLIHAFVEVIGHHQQSGVASALAARGAALTLWATALALLAESPGEARHGRPAPLSGDASRLSVVLAFIDSHLAERITLAQLARSVRLSPAYFVAFFRQRIGATPMGYLRRRRIEVARGLLLSDDRSVEEIARAVGFADPFHFSRTFRALVGATPTAYRAGGALGLGGAAPRR
jgi:AraC-like DNA-binding protein